MTNDEQVLAGFAEDIDFLFEMGSLRHLARTWVQFGGLNLANIAEHMFRVCWIAILIAQREGANVERAALLAIAHDIAESRTGDVNYLSRQYTSRNETLATRDMASGTSLETMLSELEAEWETCTTLEAQVAKDADTLDVDFELMERAAAGALLPSALTDTRRAAHERLRTATARAVAADLSNGSPEIAHRWHLMARNRINSGDWSRSQSANPS